VSPLKSEVIDIILYKRIKLEKQAANSFPVYLKDIKMSDIFYM